jgi:hypothetical protein
MRTYRYLVRAKVALVVDTRPGKNTRLAICVCNPIDDYSRPAARFILDAMLDQTQETLNSLRLRRNVFNLSYTGDTPARDVLRPLMETLEQTLQSRIEAFERGTPLTWKNCADALVTSVSSFSRKRLDLDFLPGLKSGDSY